MTVVFVHGVPDTPFMWQPLISSLGLSQSEYFAPALPGFGCDIPSGFSCTKEAYTDWLITQLEQAVQASGGPIDIVGHDWGALLTLRACSLRPDLIRSFAVANALIDREYSGHRMARTWATPVLGEVSMFLSSFMDMKQSLIDAGMPKEIADHDVSYFDKRMRSSIVKLYRSAAGLNFRGSWVDDLKNLPEAGMVLWGEHDPFVGMDVAERFHKMWGFPLHILRDTGHWGLIEKSDETAAQLKALWARAS